MTFETQEDVPTRRRSPVRRLIGMIVRVGFLAALLCLGLLLWSRFAPTPMTPLMLIRAMEGNPITREWRPLHEMADDLPVALVTAEDNNFCLHHGIDWGAVRDAYDEYVETGRRRGASTISMQLAKNLVLWPRIEAARWLDAPRKVLEVPLALLIDWSYGKRRVMEVYLNIVEFGPGLYGAQAAAQAWYGVDAEDLTARQAAGLVRQLPFPLGRTPQSNAASGRTGSLVSRLGQLGPDRTSCWRSEKP